MIVYNVQKEKPEAPRRAFQMYPTQPTVTPSCLKAEPSLEGSQPLHGGVVELRVAKLIDDHFVVHIHRDEAFHLVEFRDARLRVVEPFQLADVEVAGPVAAHQP